MPYDTFQQVFSLSLASNAVRSLKGNQEFLQKALDLGVSLILRFLSADWEVVWGPVVWKHNPDDTETGPDNAWYVAYHPRFQFEDGSVHPTYIIAIAATPKDSLYVWIKENFAVTTVTDFNVWVSGGIQNRPVTVPSGSIRPGAAYIATGTVDTTYRLLNTAGPSGGKTLLDFLKGVDQSSSPRFISTGHSLGGALSPALALSLVRAGVIPADRTLTYPTAGASPGDISFAELFAATLPPRKATSARSYQGWNLNLVNDLDIVPQAWAPDAAVSPGQNLVRIPTIYGRPVVREVAQTAILGILASRISGVLYHPISAQHFTRPPAPAVPTSLKAFLNDASHQHVQVYLDEFGIKLPGLTSEILVGGVTEKTEAEKRYNYPVIIDYQWAYDHPKQASEVLNEVQGSTEARPYLVQTETEVLSEE